jgi:large subunit ribosomal protein L32
MRRANHDRIGAPAVVDCPNCGDLMVPHRICPACGHYNGEEIIKKGGDDEDVE